MAESLRMTHPAAPTRVQRQEIALSAEAPDSFENFRILVHPMFDLVRVRAEEPFFAHASITCLPDVLLSRAVGAGARFERDHRTIARSGIDDILVLTYLSGSFRCEVDGSVRMVAAEEIAFFDLTRPFNIQTDRVDNISLHVARRRLAELLPSVADIHGTVLRQGALRDMLLAQMRTCHALAPRITTAESPSFSDAMVQLVAGGLQHAKRPCGSPTAHAGLASLTDMTNFIEDQLARVDLGPDDLARAFGLSRATLYRLFEPLGGVAAYILDRRLNRALQAITAPHPAHPRLKQLAHAVGFAHPTSFSRAFKKRFGMPPHAVRALRAYPEDVQSTAWRQAMATQLARLETAQNVQAQAMTTAPAAVAIGH
ncbi:hypothetical protein ASF44_06205 [Pseudorhodoferax sp. Leaf274]|nr:hypothetical protein ASF44_06205 [Pseudorhodoferax sp. Leaf274]